MFKYNTICSDNDYAKLEVLLEKDNTPSKQWVSIEFPELKDKEYPTQTLMWDNPDFIFGKFYKFLHRWKNNKLKKKDAKVFSDIWVILTDDSVTELIEMLDEAIKLGWYEKV